MLIFHHGHSEFLLELADGYRILTDPFDAHVGYPMRRVRCDAVTVSHAHGDHSEVGKAENYTALVDHAGTTVLAPGVVVKGIESWHDDQQGALRGPNRIYILEADGLRIAHLGDLGAWDDALAERLTGLDILLIPVGGYYTIDAQSAASLCHRVQPRIIIPMHYRTQANADCAGGGFSFRHGRAGCAAHAAFARDGQGFERAAPCGRADRGLTGAQNNACQLL